MSNFTNLVLCGGGIKGIAYASAFKAIYKLDKMKFIQKVIGTSVGSMFGLLVACKCTDTEIEKYTAEFYDEITNLPESKVQQAVNLSHNMGLHSNKNIYNVVNKMLFEKYKIDNMTMEQLYDITKIEFTTVTTNLSERKVVYMNHTTYPDMEIAFAIMASTAVPIFYEQVKLDDIVYCDGGVVVNFPINFYDGKDGVYNPQTLGMKFVSDTDKKGVYTKINNIVDLLTAIESTQLYHNDEQCIENYDKRSIISIDTGDVSATDFEITKEQKQMLLNNGYDATIKFFEELKSVSYYEYFKSFIWH